MGRVSREHNIEYCARRKADLIEAGLCYRCGIYPVTKFKICIRCRRMARIVYANWKSRRVKQ